MHKMMEVENLHVWYGESHVLHDVNLSIGSGEVVTLLGRNGAGRTTALRAIMGLVPSRRGSIRINDVEAIHLPTYKIARLGVGYCPEERGIFSSLSAEENLTLPPPLSSTERGMSLTQIYDLFPNLLERRRSPGTRLSGGEQQMLAIARILRRGVRLLLLDEISEGLAPVIVQTLSHVIKTLKSNGYTIVMVEQNFGFAAHLADRHYIMEHGQIIESFATKDIEGKGPVLKKMLAV